MARTAASSSGVNNRDGGGPLVSFMRRLYARHSFSPGVFGILTNPFYLARRGLYENIAALSSSIGGRTLDVGCGQKPYRKLFEGVSEYVGLEVDTPANRASKQADIYYDGGAFPFADGEFDSVVTSQVFEHVFTPAAFLLEIRRVLKAGGCLLLTAPFVWDEHEQPADFARYSSFGLRHVLTEAGFTVIESRKSLVGAGVLAQLANAMVYKKAGARVHRTAWLAAAMLVMAPVSMIGWVLGKVRHSADGDLYLDNVVLARKEGDR
jgi:SAM-dependent methyltransferase